MPAGLRNADEIMTVNINTGTKMSIHRAHSLLGHGNEEVTNKTAKELGWVLTRSTLKPCEHTSKSKARQKNVAKESTAEKTTVSGYHMYLDLLKVTINTGDGKLANINRDNWRIMVCEATGKKWSDFTDTKVGMVERTCKQLHKFKMHGIGM